MSTRPPGAPALSATLSHNELSEIFSTTFTKHPDFGYDRFVFAYITPRHEPASGERPIVSSKYGQGDSNPSTEQWGVPKTGEQQFPSQQFGYQQDQGQQNWQQYQSPAYAQHQYSYPQQPQQASGKNATPWIIALAGVLLAALVGVLAYMGGTGAFNRSSGESQEPVVVTEIETRTLEEQAPAQQRAPEPAPAPARYSYGNYSAASSRTSGPFAANVYSAFVDAYNNTGSPNVTVNVYSPVTGYTYTMSCSGGSTVYCTGGNNARVRIW